MGMIERMKYYNLLLRGKAVGSIQLRCQALWDEYPETYGEYFTSYDGECDEEIEETYGEDYKRGLIMYAVECSKEDAHPLELDEEGIIRTIDDWQPCLHIWHKGNHPLGIPDIWQEVYATWGDAMRDAEEKWAMLPEWFKDAVRSRDGSAHFELRKGLTGPAKRDWAEDYIPVVVTMPRNKVGIRKAFWNPDDDLKLICYTLVPYPGPGIENRTIRARLVIDMAEDRYLLSHSSHPSCPIDIHIEPCGRTHEESDVVKGETTELFDYDGFMPIHNIHNILHFLPSISYSNGWTQGKMMFIDDGELDRALEANKDWLAYMDVQVKRLADSMKEYPWVFEGTYLGTKWDWNTRTEMKS